MVGQALFARRRLLPFVQVKQVDFLQQEATRFFDDFPDGNDRYAIALAAQGYQVTLSDLVRSQPGPGAGSQICGQSARIAGVKPLMWGKAVRYYRSDEQAYQPLKAFR